MGSKYKVTEQIGKGATSIVYEGISRKTQEKVAIKVVDSRNRRNLHLAANEIHVLQRLSHPNVIKIIETVETETQTLIVMEKCKFSLSSVAKSGSLPYKTVLRIFRDILVGLRYLHANGVIHRDIKLGNVMISEKNDLKIIDFGLSKDTTRSAARTFCGTPDFISPEMMERQPYTKKTDVFSAGMLIYFLVFRCDYSRAQIEAGRASSEYGGLVCLIERMLEKSPEKRISAEEALSDRIFKGFNPKVTEIEGLKDFRIKTKLGEISCNRAEIKMEWDGRSFTVREGLEGIYEKEDGKGEMYTPFYCVDTRKLKLVSFCYSIISLVKKRTPVVAIITEKGQFYKMAQNSTYVYHTPSGLAVYQNGKQTSGPKTTEDRKKEIEDLIKEANLALKKETNPDLPITIDKVKGKRSGMVPVYGPMGVSVESGTLAHLYGGGARKERTPVFIREGVLIRLEAYVYGLMLYSGGFMVLDVEKQTVEEYAEGENKRVYGIDSCTEKKVLERIVLFEKMLDREQGR